MKICRFNEDRLGVVVDGTIRDITDIQTEIRSKARYDMLGDAVIAALPEYRERMEAAAAAAPGIAVEDVTLLPPMQTTFRWRTPLAPSHSTTPSKTPSLRFSTSHMCTP